MRIATLFGISVLSLSTFAAPGQFHYVGSLQAEVKTDASVESETKFVIAIGRKVVEFQRKGEWLNVGIDKAGGRDGWVHIDNLKPTDPDGIAY